MKYETDKEKASQDQKVLRSFFLLNYFFSY